MSSDRGPFDEIERVFDRLSEQFEELDPGELGLGSGRLPVDLHDEGERFVLVADLAGYDGDDIGVRVTDGRRVEVSAERETGTEREEAAVHVRRERRESVSRSVSLPESVDEDATDASFEGGVLTVTLPKRDPDEGDGHSIPVN